MYKAALKSVGVRKELDVTEGNKSWREVKATAFLGIVTAFLVALGVSVPLTGQDLGG